MRSASDSALLPSHAWLRPDASRAFSSPQGIIRGGAGQILSLVEDALRGGADGDSQFVVRPERADPRRERRPPAWCLPPSCSSLPAPRSAQQLLPARDQTAHKQQLAPSADAPTSHPSKQRHSFCSQHAARPYPRRRDILERSWTSVRLQKRFQDKVRKIQMRMEVRGPLPATAIVDAERASQILTNLVRAS